MKTSIALIGFMGTGKTVAGKLLAEKLGKEFIELDAVVEKKAGKSIPEVFHENGEISFRELEIEATREVANKKNAVIACGGGVVLNKINIDRLRKECIVICLTASPQVIIKRTSGDEDERPLLDVSDRASQVEELIKFRRPYYERSADITVNTTRMSIDMVVKKIIGKIKDNES